MRHAFRRLALSVLCVALTAASTRAAASDDDANVRDERPNVITVEIGGRGGLLTTHYERYLTNQISIGAGAGMGLWVSQVFAIFPAYLAGVWGDRHALYVSAGVTMIVGFDSEESEVFRYPFGTVTAGYQYQHSKGFFVRPTLSALYNDEGVLPWPGVSIGYSF